MLPTNDSINILGFVIFSRTNFIVGISCFLTCVKSFFLMTILIFSFLFNCSRIFSSTVSCTRAVRFPSEDCLRSSVPASFLLVGTWWWGSGVSLHTKSWPLCSSSCRVAPIKPTIYRIKLIKRNSYEVKRKRKDIG